MARRQAVSANLPGRHEQWIKLHVVIAHCAWNRSSASEIFLHKGLHYGFLEALLVIHNVVRHAQVLRDALGVVYIIQRTAAMAVRSAAVELRQAALVPELHRQPDDGRAALLQNRGNRGAVHPAAHRDGGHRWLCLSRIHPNSIPLNECQFVIARTMESGKTVCGGKKTCSVILSEAKNLFSILSTREQTKRDSSLRSE